MEDALGQVGGLAGPQADEVQQIDREESTVAMAIAGVLLVRVQDPEASVTRVERTRTVLGA